MAEWHPIARDPRDGKFRFYGLFVKNERTGFKWFEAYYVAEDDDGQLIDSSGDHFSDWTMDDFQFWADAPPQPPDPVSTAKLGSET
jgi:hypothetical protein